CIPNTIISNINVYNINSSISDDYNGISRAFEIIGWNDKEKIEDFNISNSNFISKEFGRIAYANVKFNNVSVDVSSFNNSKFDNYDDR
nr:hypothetical protein [Acholeplasmatales bacterium]